MIDPLGHPGFVKAMLASSALNSHWLLAEGRLDGQMWWTRNQRERVIWSIAVEQDGRMWLHVSYSRVADVPRYKDLVWVHKHFIGEDNIAYQVFAPRDEHVNIHPNCLHLWAPIGCRPTPPFHGYTSKGDITL